MGFGSGSLRSLHQEFSQLISSSELNHQLQMMQLQSSRYSLLTEICLIELDFAFLISSQMTTGNSSTGSDKISARASPPTQNLHVISEVDDNLHSTTCSFPNDGKLTVDPINFSNKSEWDRPNDTAVDSSGPLISNERPIINITDESGTLLSSQKASPDPSLYAGSVQIVSNPYDTGTIQRPFLNGVSKRIKFLVK